jgi:hypothetical protein
MKNKTKSKTSPKGGRRGCLGKDGKYSIENCNGDLEAQGIGQTTGQGTSNIVRN